MLTASVKGVAALSTAGILLFGAGSAARADLAPPGAPGVDQVQQQAQAAPDPSTVTSQAQNAPGTDSRDAGQAPSTSQQSSPASTPQDSTVIVPAPPGAATASVLRVNPLDTCVSCTSAEAGFHSAHARATAIRLLGNNISASGENTAGRSSGALLAIPANPLLALALADWDTGSDPGATSTAHSRASLLDLAIGPTTTSGHGLDNPTSGAITLAVFESRSDAGFQGLASHGNGGNNGVDLNVGQGALVIILLHSDASSSNTGSAYVVGINGSQLVSTDQTGASGIPISIPGVVDIVLLQVGAAGGNGAAVGTVSNLLGQTGETAGILTSSAVGLTGLQATPNAGTPPTTGTPSAASVGGGLKAPLTGAAMGLGGFLLLASGGGLLGVCLRRRRNAA
jgi:hypothetical protein